MALPYFSSSVNNLLLVLKFFVISKRDYERAQAKLPRVKKGFPYQIGPSKYMKNVFNKTKRRSEAYIKASVALLFKLAFGKMS